MNKCLLLLLLLIPIVSESGETNKKLSIQNVHELVIGQEYEVSVMQYHKYTEPEKFIYIGDLTMQGNSKLKLTEGILKNGIVVIK